MSSKKPQRPARDMHPAPDLGNVIGLSIDERIGLISDTHFGSKMEGVRQLEQMYDDFADAAVEQVFHCGDMVDGERVYRGHRRYLKDHGYEEQARNVIDNYPERKDITTYFITGNHDLSFYIHSGADIGNYIAAERDDLEYMGMYYARYQEGSFKFDVIHPSGGGFYSKSYGIQKWLRNNEMPSTYPDVFGFGHWHRHGYFEDHEVECIMAGGFQEPNEYHIRKGLTGDIGGWILDIYREDDILKGLTLDWRKQR